MSRVDENNSLGAIAIIGMSGRFPDAPDVDSFWENLRNGVESVKCFSRNELIHLGVNGQLLDTPQSKAAEAVLQGMDLFDAPFFDYSPREAEIMDPQHRLFLESAWEALENAGYNSEFYQGRVAVYTSANLSGYLIRNLNSNPGLVDSIGSFKLMIANGQDFLATKVSYKMNLTGPSVNVNTLCSSSLVALHYACQNLLNYGCDMALAGGVSFQVSRNEVFFYQEGGIGSYDGHCRAFDAKATGIVSGSGLAVVVLKRMEDAIADGDHIHAIIKGIGINNDGSSKSSYTAPNVEGQAECIAEAIALSGVDPETITYIEANGTGTSLGDPMEIAALTKAFRSYTKKNQYCAIGSVKTNIGHLVNAGGLAGVIKTVQAMKRRLIPPTLNFEAPNPKIDFINSPFYVNNRLSKWETNGFPLRAGVSSFGIGGTNAHVILEEAPCMKISDRSLRPWQLILLSAKTETALETMTQNLAEYVKKNPDLNLADLAFTLQVGRGSFNYRRMLVCRDADDLNVKLETMAPEQVWSCFRKPKERPVVFMFSDEGSQVLNLSLELYRAEPTFREIVDQYSKLAEPFLGLDIRVILYPELFRKEDGDGNPAHEATVRAANFIIGYALAKLWLEWEVEPRALIGTGVGEYTAACLSGVFSPEDALMLVTSSNEAFPEKTGQVTFHAPRIPFISSRTGNWIEDAEAVSPEYWIHPRAAVRFTEGLQEILKDPGCLLVEIGPGNQLRALADQLRDPDQIILSAMSDPAGSDPGNRESAMYHLLKCAGQLWLAGGRINWNRLYLHEKRRRIALPTYPFERQRYWIESGKRNTGMEEPEVYLSHPQEITEAIIGSRYREGILTIKFDFGSTEDQTLKKKLAEILLLKGRLEELCQGLEHWTSGIVISDLGLRAGNRPLQNTMDIGGRLTQKPRPKLPTPYIPPRNPTEEIIAEVSREILGFDRIGVHDDFFDLGGHSLLAMTIITRLRKIFKKDLSLQSLFENTTIAQLARILADNSPDGPEADEDYEAGRF